MIQTAAGLVAVSAALLAGPAPRAELSQFGPAPRAELSLTYSGKVVRLTCDPTGGGHPKPTEACAVLRRAGADPGKLKPGDSLCILLYQPVTARLNGVWRGKTVKWQKTYGNTCEMNRATGVLFAF